MPKYSSQRVEPVEKVSVPESKSETTKLVSYIDARMYVTGMYSGREYFFDGAGSVVDVDNRDVEWMLEKRRGERQCCGGDPTGNQVFALAEE